MALSLLLDLYGTLVEPDWERLMAGRDAIAQRAGVAPDLAHAAWAATHERRMVGEFGSLEGDLAAIVDAASTRSMTPFDDGLLQELAVMERANWAAGVRLYPDVVPVLSELRLAGVRSAIVTNASAEAAGVIAALGLDRLVDIVVASCEARAAKPRLFEIALAELCVSPSDAVLVDDAVDQVLAAERIGIRAVLVRRADADDPGAVDPGRPFVADLTGVPELILGGGRAPRR